MPWTTCMCSLRLTRRNHPQSQQFNGQKTWCESSKAQRKCKAILLLSTTEQTGSKGHRQSSKSLFCWKQSLIPAQKSTTSFWEILRLTFLPLRTSLQQLAAYPQNGGIGIEKWVKPVVPSFPVLLPHECVQVGIDRIHPRSSYGLYTVTLFNSSLWLNAHTFAFKTDIKMRENPHLNF